MPKAIVPPYGVLRGELGIGVDGRGVAGRPGERVDVGLRDGVPLAPPEVGADAAEQVVGLLDDDHDALLP